MKSDWKELNGFPEDVKENETVWLYNIDTNFVMLGCMYYVPEIGWYWANSNGTIYAEEGKIVSECELDDEYNFTHYCKLPELPKIKIKNE